MMLQEIFNYSNSLIEHTSLDFKRYLFDEINWNSKLIEITGSRGVGKTTLMLQKAKLLNKEKNNQTVYLSLDDKLMYKNSITETAEELLKYGVTTLFLDEVHKYPPKIKGFDWSAEIKNVYDRFPGLKIVYSGSSVLKIYKGLGDLSRRKSSYRMVGMSFREYLFFNKHIKSERIQLKDILTGHQKITSDLTNKIKIIPHFKNYLRNGYFPFYYEDPSAYFSRLNSIINVIIETDIPAVSEISFETSFKLKKLLAAIASSVPFTPNLLNLRKELYVADQRTLLKYLDFLEKAEVISTLTQKAKGNKIMHKPDKIFLGNTNYYYAFEMHQIEIGTVREIFFYSMLNLAHNIKLPPKGDFIIDDTTIIEIGGKNKTQQQINDLNNAYLVLDDIENGIFNRIPLWLFGFLY